ncbi:DUF6090 family protein [Nonlabens marinus]|uniref:Uncharacterized protein n=1 Tax=Nonlabens marinus S1-08 TaxID=1454201 RepID=W8W0R2_9FLAO|nr:DUF6090 family protein [Nonlabens marinus]BAO56771.1 hypothetical protein NMS_2762 [Nonlabens marinus S1-08]
MIKFFRNIRKNLLKEGKTTRYFKYAIGEIVLVVIGILIALSINNWNEERKARAIEQKILVELQIQFKDNLVQLENKIYQRKIIIKNSNRALELMDNKTIVAMDTLTTILSPLILCPTFDPVDNEIMTAENLQLIQNDSLRYYLTTFSSGIVDFKDQESEWVDIYRNIIIEHFIDLGITRNINVSFFLRPENLSYVVDKTLIEDIQMTGSKNLPAVEEILADKKLKGILANAVGLNISLNWDSEGYRKNIITILELIENEIE